jgi:hypothetical protein
MWRSLQLPVVVNGVTGVPLKGICPLHDDRLLVMLARRDEPVPAGLTDPFMPVQRRGSRSNKARFVLVAAAVTALVVAAALLAGSVKSDSGFAFLSQTSQYDDEKVVEKFDELTHKVHFHHRSK